MKKPLVRPIPFEDESPGSVILRASSLNGWKSLNLFLRGLNVISANNSISLLIQYKSKWAKAIEKLAIKTGCQEISYDHFKITKRSFLNFDGIPIQSKHLRIDEPAICSECIKEMNYANRLWDFRLITACTKHKKLLLTTCPGCQKNLTWNRQSLLTCKCGHELESNQFDKHQINASRYIEDLIKNRNDEKVKRLLKIFDQANQFVTFFNLQEKIDCLRLTVGIVLLDDKVSGKITNVLHHLAEDLGIHPRLALFPFLDSKYNSNEKFFIQLLKNIKPFEFGQIKHDLAKKILTTKEVSNALGISGFLVKKFIQNNILSAHKKDKSNRWLINLSSVNELLILLSNGTKTKTTYVPVSKIIKTPKFTNDLVNLVKDTTTGKKSYAKMDLSVGLMSVYIEMDQAETKVKELVSAKYIAKLCGVHPANIFFCVRIGLIKRVNPRLTKGRKFYFKKKHVKAFNQKYIFIGELAKKFKLRPNNLAEKIMTLNITPISGPRIDGNLTYIFKRADLKNINIKDLASLKNYATKTGRKVKQNKPLSIPVSIPLRVVRDKLNLSIGKINKLINHKILIEKKSLKREIEVTQESFNSLQKVMTDKALITLCEALKQTNETKYAFLRRWVYTDFITLTDIKIEIYISKKDLTKVLNFKKKYVTSQEGGDITNTNRSYLPNLEKLGKIKVAKTLKGSGQAVKFYLKDDVIKILSG